MLGRCSPTSDVAPVEPGWEDAWRTFHRPVRAGGLWIGPPWERPDAGEPSVVIDPGRAFGTGAHPTTRLCIELLARGPSEARSSTSAAARVCSRSRPSRLGFEPVRAVDNDPVAVETTIANAAVNGVAIEAARARRRIGRAPTRGHRRRERPARAGREDPRPPRRAGRDHLRLPDGRSASRARVAGGRLGSSSTAGRPTASSACGSERLRRPRSTPRASTLPDRWPPSRPGSSAARCRSPTSRRSASGCSPTGTPRSRAAA